MKKTSIENCHLCTLYYMSNRKMTELTLVYILRKNVGFGIKGTYLGFLGVLWFCFKKMYSWFLEFSSYPVFRSAPCGRKLPSFYLLHISFQGISPSETGAAFQDTSVHCAA